MKKLLSLVLSLLCIVSCTGCVARMLDVGGTTLPDPSKQQPGGGLYTVTAGYDYGMHRPGLATMLYSSSTLFFDLPEGYDPPVAGDEFAITYTGELLIQESYPSTVVITGGKVIGVTAEPAVIRQVRYHVKDKSLTLLDENGEEVTLTTGSIQFPEYYLIGTEGNFAELSTLTEDTILYGSVSPTEQKSDGGITFSGLYRWNPREVDPAQQAKMRAVTDPFVKKTYGVTDLSPYDVEISTGYVRYNLKIGGYRTNETIYVNLDDQLTVTNHMYPDQGKYSCFLKNATEEAIRGAEERMREKCQKHGDTGSGFYLQIDQEGYLCLAVEFIVTIDPPKLDEDGNEIGGCGYDHDHVFYMERICKAD